MTHTRPVWAEISRSRLLANWELLRKAAPSKATLLAVLKANAYGHGVLDCGPLLAEAGAGWLGVTCVEEGIALRRVCPQARILVMSGLWDGEAEAVIEHRLTPQVWEPFHFAWLEAAAKKIGCAPQSVPVHLEIDSGMARQGVRSPDALRALLSQQNAGSAVRIEGVMTHFSTPEVLSPDETEAQIVRFVTMVSILADAGVRFSWLHAGNSATLFVPQHTAALTYLAAQHNAQLMLRPGLALYGYPAHFTPALGNAEKQEGLRPVLSLKTRVVSMRTIEAGETAGYSMTFRAQRRTCLALVPAGYADGVNRLLSNRGHMLVRGQKACITGRISMDQTILDVTDIPGVEVGDEVAQIGEQGSQQITAADIAVVVGTIPYEVLCGISARVPRVPAG